MTQNDATRRQIEAADPQRSTWLSANAGSGKTRVLVHRIAWLVETEGLSPYSIMAVTFTNKAAREMKNRVGGMLGQSIEGMPWLGTFHSISVKILRRNAELVDLKPDFTILDTDASKDCAPMRTIKIIGYKDKDKWELCPKYNIGNK